MPELSSELVQQLADLGKSGTVMVYVVFFTTIAYLVFARIMAYRTVKLAKNNADVVVDV